MDVTDDREDPGQSSPGPADTGEHGEPPGLPAPLEPAVQGTPPEPPEPIEPALRVSTVPPEAPPLRHHVIVRITHWLNLPLIVLMAASGLQIYRAYPRFGERGGPYAPNPLQDVAIPEWARLGGWLAGGLHWHFMVMWLFMAVGLAYLVYMLASGEWRKLVFRPSDLPEALQMVRYYLRVRKDYPALGKHNALQKGAYTSIVLLGVVSVLTGLAVWKPIQLSWLVFVFGGFQAARYWHFVAVWLFAGFTVVHTIMVLFTDPATLRAMVTGRYRGVRGGG